MIHTRSDFAVHTSTKIEYAESVFKEGPDTWLHTTSVGVRSEYDGTRITNYRIRRNQQTARHMLMCTILLFYAHLFCATVCAHMWILCMLY